MIRKIFQNIFSVKNSNDAKHKVITLLGIKIKIKRRYKIHIAFICDNNYVVPTITAIKSIYKNRIEQNYYYINIVTDDLTIENEYKIKQCSSRKFNINIINKSETIKKYSNLPKKRHVSRAALLKFFLPEIFPNLSKILYLDSDIIVQQDLAELYNININEYYAAVVKDTLCVLSREYMDSIGIYNKYYFNSGVMLLNLDLMRKDNISEKFIDYRIKEDKQMFMDQDAFNAIIGHKVKYISYKYNFLNYYLTVMNFQDLSKFFGEDLTGYANEKALFDSCTIIHLGGKEKPWNTPMGYLTELYNTYSSISEI